MNYSEILSILQEKIEGVSQFAYEDFDSNEMGLGDYEIVEKYGGEGKGEEWYKVFYFVEHDVYVRIDGWYSSYNGTDFEDGWNCCKEVKPQQKVVTVYE